MFDRAQSMLPKTATDLARALDILEERLFMLPVAMISKNPMTVSEALLDHLAWENSVDVWDIDWPESVKRSVVATSSELHRYKGTPFAIKSLLSAMGWEAALSEWWEYGGMRGTFRVAIDLGDSGDRAIKLMASKERQEVAAAVRAAAPVSRSFDLKVNTSKEMQFSILRPLQQATKASVGLHIKTSLLPRTVRIATARHVSSTLRIAPSRIALNIPDAPAIAATALHRASTTTIHPMRA